MQQLDLPNWPARRLVVESVIAWGFRHLDDARLDAHCSPWPLVRGAVLAFLRHSQTDFDAKLRARCEHDPAYRDELAKQIEQAAYRKYPWLRTDPRPFPPPAEAEGLFLDKLASQLTNLHTVREHLQSAINDLRRKGDAAAQDQLSFLREEATVVSQEISRLYGMLTRPKTGRDSVGHYSHFFALSRPEEQAYYFFSAQPLAASRLDYVGVKCPRCGASVAQRKQLINLGQGHNRVRVWSCHCLTYSAHQPPRMRLEPISLAYWTKLVRRSEGSS
jgi:hypothetical protein